MIPHKITSTPITRPMITPIRNALGGNAFCSVKEAQDLGAFK